MLRVALFKGSNCVDALIISLLILFL